MGRVVRAANKPEADLLHSKIEELARTNDAQHGEVTRAVLGLRQDFVAHMDSANDARSLIEAQIAEVRVLILHRTDPTGEMPITVKETP